MKRLHFSLSLALVAALAIASSSVAWAASSNSQDPDTPLLRDAQTTDGPAFRFSNAGSGLAKAAADTFILFGGPNSLEGKFQNVLGGSGGAADLQGWTGVDRTQQPTFWHVDTFNSSNFTGAGATNQAMWCGVPAATPGYSTPPGYGNNWDDRIVFNTTVDPLVGHDIRLQFEYNYESEGGYDFFMVEYDSSNVTKNLLSVSGSSADTNGVFIPLVFDQTWNMPTSALGGLASDEITLRIRFTSDGAWSDEDGLNPTSVGAAQVDNIKVFVDGNLVSTADFDGAAGDADWVNEAAPFVGDFSKVFQQFNDIDPCRSNATPVAGFIDNGMSPNNAPGETTGGMTSANWSYGIPGGWVTNYDGGLTFGSDFALNNDLWSPEILWDDPSTTADDAISGGAFLRFDAWTHLPRLNGMRWVYYVRSFPDPSGAWSSWNNRGFVYFSANSSWTANQIDVSDMLVQNPQKVQISVATRDMAEIFGYPGGDATPAPVYDNITFAKYQAGGPAHSQRTIDPFMDSFPNSGAIDVGGGLANLAIRIDMTNEINTGTAAIAGDSTVIDVVPVIPGTTLAANPDMNWVLDANPLFDSVRVLPAGATLAGTFTGRDGRTWNRWTGTVAGQQSTTATGAAVADRYFFDLPDGPANPSAPHQVAEDPMFFPGDLIRYHFATTDTGGNTSTLPASTAGFLDGNGYSRAYTIRGLPSLLDGDGNGIPTQPSILVIDDAGRSGEENDFLNAFAQNGLVEGVDFDTYTANAPSSSVTDGIGSAGLHGANADQLSGYSTMFYFIGNATNGLSNGVLAGDKGDDIGVLTQWHGLAGDRYFAYFGDNFASRLQNIGGTGLTYLSTLLGVTVQDADVRDDIGGQTSATVAPTAAGAALFAQNFVAFGGCLGINTFDNIGPLPGAVASHEFLSPGGAGGAYSAAGAVWHERTQNVAGTLYNRVDATFPYGFRYIRSSTAKAGANVSATTTLMEELLTAFGQATNPGGATPAPAPRLKTALYDNAPNPFNPSTTIAFRIGEKGDYSLKVYNLRGEHVRTLIDGELDAGDQRVIWNGRDRSGAAVSSGVYLYSLEGKNFHETRKMALVK